MARVSRRRCLGGAAGALGSVLAAACNDQTVPQVGEPQAEPAGTPGPQGPKGEPRAPRATATPEVVVVVHGDGPPPVITLWSSGYDRNREGTTGERPSGFELLFAYGQERYPHITLNIEAEGTPEKIIAAYAANQQPDFYDSNYMDVGRFGQNGMLVDLNDFIKADREYADSLADYFPFLLETSSWAGQFWSLPWYTNVDLPYTNLAHLKESELEPLELGYTWDDLVEYLKKLQTTHGKGEETNKWAMGGMTNQVQLWNLLLQNGGEIYNEDATKAVFNSPEGVEAGQYIHDLLYKHQVHVPHRDVHKERGMDSPSFRQGQISMFYETSGPRIKTWAEDIGGLENMYVTPSPTKKQASAGNFGRNWLIFKSTPERQEAAWELTRWLTATKQNALYLEITGFLPPRKSIFETGHWKWWLLDQVPQLQTFADAVLMHGYRPWHPNIGTHYRAVGAAMSAAFKTPNVSIKDTLDEVANTINVDMEKFRASFKGSV